MENKLLSRKQGGSESLSLTHDGSILRKIILGLSVASTVLLLAISVHASTPSKSIDELEKRIETIEQKQSELEQETRVATKIYDAKWEILILVIVLLLGGGGAVFFALHRLLGGLLVRDAEHHRDELSRRLDAEIETKLKTEIIASEVRMRSSHAYIYGDISDGYDPHSRAWRKHLESSIEQSKEALEGLERLPETYPKRKRRKASVSNNLAYAMAVLGDSAFREEALKHATYAKENVAEIPDGYHWKETYGWVLLALARNDGERQEGIGYLLDLYNCPDLPQGWVANRREKLSEFLRDQS